MCVFDQHRHQVVSSLPQKFIWEALVETILSYENSKLLSTANNPHGKHLYEIDLRTKNL